MVAYVAISGALYLVLLLLFQLIDISSIPQVGAGRIGIAIPVVFSYLFGPAVAWSAPFANVGYDYSKGLLNQGSLFGFIANFMIGYVPYRIWNSVTQAEPDMKSPWKIALFAYNAVLVNVIAGDIIGWGVNWLFGVPFAIVGSIVALSNSFWAVIFGAPLMAAAYRAIKGQYPLFYDIMGKPNLSLTTRTRRRIAAAVLSVSSFGCLLSGVYLGLNYVALIPFLGVMALSTVLI